MRARTIRVTATAAAMALALGAAACGDDDDETSADDTTSTTVGTAEFCDAVVDFHSAVFQVQIDDDTPEAEIVSAGEDLSPLTDALVESAPDGELSDGAEDIDAAVKPLLDGDAEAFNADATFEGFTEFVSGAVEACDFPGQEVTAVDYAFEGVPASLTAGTIAFTLDNVSETEEHEMIVFRKADGETLSIAELLELPEEETEDRVVFKGAAFAPPGETGTTLATLDAGSYGMVCFIPVGGAEDGPPHFTQGMLQEFTVT